jgi:circadian clock protein KaiC
MSSKGIHVGDVLTNFHGILTGVPTFDEDQCDLLMDDDHYTNL